MIPCTGPLLWHEVPADDRFTAAGVLECAQCGFIVCTTGLMDDAHARTMVLTVE